jgi:hypothetical protein
MKVELHINGGLNVLLMPETEIERVVLSAMLTNADKGQAVKLKGRGDGETVVVEVEK